MVESLTRALLLSGLIALPPALLAAADAPSAELKVGLGVENLDVKDASSTLKIAPDTKVWAWTRVTGCAGSSVNIAFEKDGKAVFARDLDIPGSPYRTYTWRTFRAGDAGAWTVKVTAKDGTELAKTDIQVEVGKQP